MPKRVAALISHSHPPGTSEAVEAAVAAAGHSGWRLVATPGEIAKHGAAPGGVETRGPLPPQVDPCPGLGGDGSILSALRHFSAAGGPVFGVDFGTVGFLSAVERDAAGEAQVAHAGLALREPRHLEHHLFGDLLDRARQIHFAQDSNRVFATLDRELEEPFLSAKKKRVFVSTSRDAEASETWQFEIPARTYEAWMFLCWRM